jgi:hypothetical protein
MRYHRLATRDANSFHAHDAIHRFTICNPREPQIPLRYRKFYHTTQANDNQFDKMAKIEGVRSFLSVSNRGS